MQSTVDMAKDLQKIIKEGFLDKQSRFIKAWRKYFFPNSRRWFVLTPTTLYTFKQRKIYNSPTEVLPLKQITSIKSCEDETQKEFTFKIDSVERSFYMCASSTVEKEQWIGQIGKAMVKLNSRENDFE